MKLLQGIPHVQLVRKHPSLGTQWFGLNDQKALREATGHLVDLGHSRIAYIGGPAERSTGHQHLEDYRQGLHDVGLPKPAGLVEVGPPSSVDHGRDAIRRLLKLDPAPTAVVLGSIQHTVGAMDELFRSTARMADMLANRLADAPPVTRTARTASRESLRLWHRRKHRHIMLTIAKELLPWIFSLMPLRESGTLAPVAQQTGPAGQCGRNLYM